MTNSEQNGNTEQIDAVEFFWRPGCPFCAILERDLDVAAIPLRKRNIWDEPGAAEFVRSVADGNETVPTIFVGGRAMVNPPIAAVTDLLAEVAPHLVSS
ncbi:MAG: glutaredoxin domain-containing protein [Actinomycetota bacterium]